MPETEKLKKTKQRLRGVVLSAAMDKTIVVKIERLVKHEQYEKYVRRNTKYYAHDEQNQARVGDKVEISEARPLSKLKRWRLVNVIEAAPREEEQA